MNVNSQKYHKTQVYFNIIEIIIKQLKQRFTEYEPNRGYFLSH